MTEKLDLLNIELRTCKRQVSSYKRRMAQYEEDKKRNAQNMYAGMNMLTRDQQNNMSPNDNNTMLVSCFYF
jgi:hypothetical protein